MAQDRLVRLAEVAREEQPVVVAVVAADVELDERRAEDVACVEELKRDAARDLARLVHVRRDEELHERVDVGLLVQRLEELLPFLAALLVDVVEVALLQEARVAQHDVAEVRRRLAREDAPGEALPHELRKVPRVVDVRMGENDVVDRLRIDREVSVLLERLLAVPLVEPAVEQDALAVRLDEMHGPRRRLSRSVESDFHTPIIAKAGRERRISFRAAYSGRSTAELTMAFQPLLVLAVPFRIGFRRFLRPQQHQLVEIVVL